MFNWKPADSKTDSLDYRLPSEDREKVRVPDSPKMMYAIGRTDDGRVSLRIGDDYSSHTLYMNAPGVQGLIRMLEASIADYDDDQVDIGDSDAHSV